MNPSILHLWKKHTDIEVTTEMENIDLKLNAFIIGEFKMIFIYNRN